ncbi:MAG: YceK/YidQ family lipoprotein [Planctomycetes bacterium]|nr:YceK/YidQ family lipoprotein [Planctomycetota bacterium]
MRGGLWTTVLALGLQGCAVLTSPVSALAGRPYGATQLDLEVLRHEGGGSSPGLMIPRIPPALGWFDLPFSLALDTALLPLSCLAAVTQDAGD